MPRILPQNLDAFMEAKRGSQAKIARALGISSSNVTQWRKGIRPVPDEHVPKICEILGISVEDLSQEFSPYAQKWMNKTVGKMIMETLPRLSDDGLRLVLSQALQVEQDEKQEKDG